MPLFTGYYANMKNIPMTPPFALCSISKETPSWIYQIRRTYHIDEVKPSWALISLAKEGKFDEYTELYLDMLSKLDAKSIFSNLPNNSILLCYEKPSQFCHRHLLCQWLNDNDISCKEIFFDKNKEIFIDGIKTSML